MRKKIRLYLNLDSTRWSDAQEMFITLGRKDLANALQNIAGYSFYFYENDDAYPTFLDIVGKFGFINDISINTQIIYTDNELRSFPLLAIHVNTAPKGDGGPEFGTKYNLSRACPECLAGAEQVSPLIVKASSFPHKPIIQTYSFEILMELESARILEKEKMSGFKFMEVFSYKNKKILPWLQLLPQYTLPQMSSSTKGIICGSNERGEAPCSLCGRDGHFHTSKVPLEIFYKKSIMNMNSLPDIMKTYEYFGKTLLKDPFEQSIIANQMIIVKPKMLDFLRRLKIKDISFEPIRLE